MNVLETDRLILRETNSAIDAEFVFELLNTPKFIKYIGDRGVRTVEDASDFIDKRYRVSYRDNGFGLYVAERKNDGVPVGLCGFVKRDTLPGPDIGFAFLPQYEKQGYGFESAKAVLDYGRETLGFSHVLAITSQDNAVSGKLLQKLGFAFDRILATPDGEELKLFGKYL